MLTFNITQIKPSRSMAGSSSTIRSPYISTSKTTTVRRAPAPICAVDIDPETGMEVEKLACEANEPNRSVTIDGMKIAYRMSEVDPNAESEGHPPVVCVHGLAYMSFCYRNTLREFSKKNQAAVAFDWPGHGYSDKPSPNGPFKYTEKDYVDFFGKFLDALDLPRPVTLLVHGYVLSQYALLYAIRNPEDIGRIIIHGVPLDQASKMREELQKYKNPIPFMRPKNPINGAYFCAQGAAVVQAYNDAIQYDIPLNQPECDTAIRAAIDATDFPLLLRKVDEGFRTWRKPAMLVYGTYDPFTDFMEPVTFLKNKRTNMRQIAYSKPLGHVPMEEEPEGMNELYFEFFRGERDELQWSEQSQAALNPTGKNLPKMWEKQPTEQQAEKEAESTAES